MYTKAHDTYWKSMRRKKASDDAKLLFLYLISNQHRNLLGFYYLPLEYIQVDLCWKSERVSKGFGELFQKGLAAYDDVRELVLIPGFLEHNPFDNPNVEKSGVKLFEETVDLHKSPLLRDFQRVLEGLPKPFKTLLETVTQTVSNKETEEETETETEVLLLGAGGSSKQEPSNQHRIEEEGDDETIPPDPPKRTPLISLPLIDGTEYDVVQAEIDQWAQLYQAVDVPQQFREMLGWCMANPKKLKTRGGIKRFINGWLAREQNRGGSKLSTANAASSTGNTFFDMLQEEGKI